MEKHYVEIPDLFDEDDEVRELTEEEAKLLRPFSELPEEDRAFLSSLKGARPVVRQTIALPPDVVEPFRARGEGWERVVEGVLRDWLRDHAA